jgi:hypothetical protein
MIMKKLIGILVIACTLCANKTMAQIQRGNVLVGGDIASLKFASGGVFDVNIDPKAAFFLKDNFALGAYVNFGLNTAKDQSTTTTYGVGPLARYYINDPKTNVLRHGRLFFEGNVGIEGNNTAHVSTNGLGLGIGPGYAYFITPNVGLEALLKYNGIVGFGNQAYSSTVNLGFGFQIYLSNRAQKNILNEVK